MYPYKADVVYVRTVEDRKQAMFMLRYCADVYGMIALDTETDGLDPRYANLHLITLATPDTAFVFDRTLFTEPMIVSVLADHTIAKLVHYAPFEYGFLSHHLVAPHTILDTKRAITKHRWPRTSLKSVVERLLCVSLDKGPQLWFVNHPEYDEIPADVITYAGIDALVLWPLFFNLRAIFPKDDFLVQEYDLLPMDACLKGLTKDLPDMSYESLLYPEQAAKYRNNRGNDWIMRYGREYLQDWPTDVDQSRDHRTREGSQASGDVVLRASESAKHSVSEPVSFGVNVDRQPEARDGSDAAPGDVAPTASDVAAPARSTLEDDSENTPL